MMYLFSWNLNRNDVLLERALRHLSSMTSCIGVLQEVPRFVDDSYLGSLGITNLEVKAQASNSTYWRHFVTVATVGLPSTTETCDVDFKFLTKRFNLPGVGLTDIVNVHAISRVTEVDPNERNRRASKLRKSIDAMTLKQKIIMGDFNTAPFEFEMWDRDHLYALRDRHLVHDRASRTVTGQTSPLYNASWAWLSESPSPGLPGGTLFFNRRKQYSDWHCYDQILVSPTLIDRIIEMRVHKDLSGPLIHYAGPECVRMAIGDHLPISMEIR